MLIPALGELPGPVEHYFFRAVFPFFSHLSSSFLHIFFWFRVLWGHHFISSRFGLALLFSTFFFFLSFPFSISLPTPTFLLEFCFVKAGGLDSLLVDVDFFVLVISLLVYIFTGWVFACGGRELIVYMFRKQESVGTRVRGKKERNACYLVFSTIEFEPSGSFFPPPLFFSKAYMNA